MTNGSLNKTNAHGESGIAPPIVAVPASVSQFLVLFWIVCVLIGTTWFLSADAGLWFVSGALASLIVTAPLLSRQYEVLSPWTLVVATVYISCGVRGLFIALSIDGTRSIDALFLLGHDAQYFFRPTVLFLVGLTIFTIAYTLGAAGQRQVGKTALFGASRHLNPQTTFVVVLICAFVGFVGFVIFAQSTGGLSPTRISAKRTTINGLDLSTDYESFGLARFANSLAPIAFLLQLTYYNYRRIPHGVLTRRFAWLSLLFLNAVALPVYASSRSSVIQLIISAVVVEYCLSGRRIRVRALFGPVIAAVVIAGLLTSLRASQAASVDTSTLNTETLVDTFVLTRTFGDIPTTGNIINAVPTKLPYANGRTITAWLVAPVPRSIWPGKPIITAGPEIGRVIYGNRASGVPPGLIAESYWNFGTGGVLLLPLLAGLILRRFSEIWRSRARSSPAAALILATAVIPLGLSVFSGSIGSAPFQVLETMVVLVPVLALVSSGKEPRRPQALPGETLSALASSRSGVRLGNPAATSAGLQSAARNIE